MAQRIADLLPLPSTALALEAERQRLERELGNPLPPEARRLLAIERRRVVIALDAIAA